jgi:hypothetical protein
MDRKHSDLSQTSKWGDVKYFAENIHESPILQQDLKNAIYFKSLKCYPTLNSIKDKRKVLFQFPSLGKLIHSSKRKILGNANVEKAANEGYMEAMIDRLKLTTSEREILVVGDLMAIRLQETINASGWVGEFDRSTRINKEGKKVWTGDIIEKALQKVMVIGPITNTVVVCSGFEDIKNGASAKEAIGSLRSILLNLSYYKGFIFVVPPPFFGKRSSIHKKFCASLTELDDCECGYSKLE